MTATLPAPTESLLCAEGQEWQITRVLDLPSTNVAASHLPAWSAVIAATQSGGYGRSRSAWVSDVGGVWLSAVLPLENPELPWALLPLVVGCSLAETLSQMGVRGHHLRWPNDLLLGRQKIAGILVEKFQADTAVVGLGLNVLNDPARHDTSLRGQVTTLSAHWDYPRTLRETSERILQNLAAAHARFTQFGFEPFARAINLHWSHPSRIEYFVHGEPSVRRARFVGIDMVGALEVMDEQGHLLHLDPNHVYGIREISS